MQKKRITPEAVVQSVSQPQCKPVSPLRARMLAAMTERQFAHGTQAAYVRAVVGLVRHCAGRRPEAIPVSEARAYVEHLRTSGVSATHAPARLRARFSPRTARPMTAPVTTLRSFLWRTVSDNAE